MVGLLACGCSCCDGDKKGGGLEGRIGASKVLDVLTEGGHMTKAGRVY